MQQQQQLSQIQEDVREIRDALRELNHLQNGWRQGGSKQGGKMKGNNNNRGVNHRGNGPMGNNHRAGNHRGGQNGAVNGQNNVGLNGAANGQNGVGLNGAANAANQGNAHVVLQPGANQNGGGGNQGNVIELVVGLPVGHGVNDPAPPPPNGGEIPNPQLNENVANGAQN
jgi:hypothetical protein